MRNISSSAATALLCFFYREAINRTEFSSHGKSSLTQGKRALALRIVNAFINGETLKTQVRSGDGTVRTVDTTAEAEHRKLLEHPENCGVICSYSTGALGTALQKGNAVKPTADTTEGDAIVRELLKNVARTPHARSAALLLGFYYLQGLDTHGSGTYASAVTDRISELVKLSRLASEASTDAGASGVASPADSMSAPLLSAPEDKAESVTAAVIKAHFNQGWFGPTPACHLVRALEG